LGAKIWLPIIYGIVAAFLIFALSGAGHGNGPELFFYVSLPSGAISLLIEKYTKSAELPVLACFLAGLIQYSAIGYVIDRIKSRGR
jgi:hypothetical protein